MKKKDVYGAMLSPQDAEARLRQTGARMTAQRRAVLTILHGNRTHPTADAVIEMVREKLGCVSTATIYNTLESLTDLGLVRRIEGLENRSHFDPDTSDHQHAICRTCKRVWDLGVADGLPGIPEGFTIEEVLVQGICVSCTGK